MPNLRLPLVLIMFLGLTGCSEALTGEPANQVDAAAVENSGKFRNEHMMDRALRPGAAGKFDNESTLQIMFGIDKQTVLERYGVMERYSVLERYQLLERYHVLERYEYSQSFDGYAITIDDSLGLSAYSEFLAELALDDEILWFEPDFSVVLPTASAEVGSTSQKTPWSVAEVGGTTSIALSGDGFGDVPVDVYILDSGVTNEDLNIVETRDFRIGHNPDANDYDGHGTHVAGIVGAVDNTKGLVGVAPGARIHNFKVLDDNGTTDVSVVVAAVEEITTRKLADPTTPMIVNMSIGEHIGTDGWTVLDYAVKASIDAGVHYVIAAGNQSVNAAHVTPAKVPDAITVGSYNQYGFFSPFSNWGSSLDILAPGEGVVSLAPGSLTPASMTGTSMAAPHVTGAVALYLSENPAATSAEVRSHLLSTSRRFTIGMNSNTTNASVWVGGPGT